MSTNFNYLTTISAIYDFVPEDEENLNIVLTIFNNGENLKILYNYNEYYIENKKILNNAIKGEILLNFGELEMELILNNINNILIKELILSKVLDFIGDHLNFEIII